MAENVVLEKSHAFALRIIRLYKFLSEEKSELVISKQVLLAGTDVGAHVKEAEEAESREIFITEMGVALRKAGRTEYWLQLLHESNFLDEKAFNSIHADCLELIKLLTKIVKTSKVGG